MDLILLPSSMRVSRCGKVCANPTGRRVSKFELRSIVSILGELRNVTPVMLVSLFILKSNSLRPAKLENKSG